jgi:phosphatidyl-myo-inositol alpha-mannosyltransferase
VRLLVAGRGDEEEAAEGLDPQVRDRITFLGQVSESDKARLLRTVDLYVAPNLGGESFGIILVEAMSAGAPVLASELGAFRRVLEDGRAGELFPVGDAEALAAAADRLLADQRRRKELREAGFVAVRRYDWSTVAQDVLAVYETVTEGAASVSEDVRVGRRFGRFGG